MGIINRVKDLGARFTAATREAREEITEMRERIKALRREINALRYAPVPAAEIHERAREAVAARGARWLEEHGRGLFGTAENRWRPLGTYAAEGHHKLPRGIETDLFGFMCAANPDHALQLLDGLVAATPFEAGPPSDERPALIARLERELAELEAAEEAAIDEACAAGVTIAHRADVVQRRATEANKREMDERAADDRRRRQDLLDRDAAERAHVGRSEYLTGGGPDGRTRR